MGPVIHGGLKRDIFDIDASGISLGHHHFKKYDKDYFYVHFPQTNTIVFQRVVIFISVTGITKSPSQFIVVRKWNAKDDCKRCWEPIKGQVEQKEYLEVMAARGSSSWSTYMQLKKTLVLTAYREMMEEGRLNRSDIKQLKMLKGVAYCSRHSDYPKDNMFYQYQFFTAEISADAFFRSQAILREVRADPASMLLRKDEREKGDMDIWSSRKNPLLLMYGTPFSIVRIWLSLASM